MKPIKMDGIRLSDEHVLVTQSDTGDSHRDPVRLYQRLSADGINISFLNMIAVDERQRITCCIPPDKLGYVQKYQSLAEDTAQFDFRTEVGTLSIYPHKFSLNALGYLISLWAKQENPFYQMVSSPSSLTFVVDTRLQDRAAAYLADTIDLPDSHTPFRQVRCAEEELLIQKAFPETVATYVEVKIKCYGIETDSDLSLFRVDVPTERLEMWGRIIQSMEAAGLRFRFASADTFTGDWIRLFLLIDTADARPAEERNSALSTLIPDGWEDRVEIESPVAIIGFQGPHFGDRYGIAHQAFSALHDQGIFFQLAGCTGASIQMVLPVAMVQKAKDALSQVFEVP